MNLRGREDVAKFVEDDEWMMNILRTVSKLNLPDWWIGAGFVRNRIWDALHGYDKNTPLADIDVVYYDKEDDSEETEKEIEKNLESLMPDIPWSVKNQARMHEMYGVSQYSSSEEAISRWVETPTCIGVSLKGDNVVVTGSDSVVGDVVNLTVRKNPDSPYIPKEVYEKRVKGKNWKRIWPKLNIIWD